MSKPEKHLLRVIKGGLVPADNYTAARMREKGYHIGDLLTATLTKPRNPKFHRLAHQLGVLIEKNIESFSGMDPHKVLKRLQIEGNVACDEVGIFVPGMGMMLQRIPQSLSFANLEEGAFKVVMRGLSRHVAATYWKDLKPEQIEDMAAAMVDE